MNIDEIKGISLVDFLHHLGYDPTGRDSKGLWFYAPYRNAFAVDKHYLEPFSLKVGIHHLAELVDLQIEHVGI